MKMVVSSAQVLKLYKTLLVEASKFPLYNFRMFTLRKIRAKFDENRHLSDPAAIEELYKEGLKSLELIKRQVIVSQLYNPDKSIIEQIHGRQ